MAHTDVFALRNSGFESFLFAEVGTERNGSSLTVLSVLARLGQDPWSEAARWTNLPRAAAIEGLASDIAQMPLLPNAVADARGIAERLVRLLPVQVRPTRSAVAGGGDAVAAGTPRIALYCAVAFGMVLNLILMSAMTRPIAAAPGVAAATTQAEPVGPVVPMVP
jgi:hypothetical protein